MLAICSFFKESAEFSTKFTVFTLKLLFEAFFFYPLKWQIPAFCLCSRIAMPIKENMFSLKTSSKAILPIWSLSAK
jgi:hypothetical protein